MLFIFEVKVVVRYGDGWLNSNPIFGLVLVLSAASLVL